MRKSLQSVYRLVVLGVFCFLAGGAAMFFELSPMRQVQEIGRYLAGGRWSDLTAVEVLQNDLGRYPYRNLAPFSPPASDGSDFRSVPLSEMRERRAPPFVWAPETDKTLRLVAGLLDVADGLHGALLFRGSELVSQWSFQPDPLGMTKPSWVALETQAVLHGLQVLPDGSLVLAFDAASLTLSRFGPCGPLIWSVPIRAHHSVVWNEKGSVWTWDGMDIVEVGLEEGDILQRIALEDLVKSSPGKYILTSRAIFDAKNSTHLDHDPFHPNDVQPLPERMASAFPMFRAGDLLVSLRSGNLIFVVDPATHEIKWWMQDGSFAQHDPDWHADGTITVFDNNTDFGESRIIRIDPATNTTSVVLDGAEMEDFFYTDLQGTHEIQADGSILATLPRQGRAVQYDVEGKRIFEFRNLYDDSRDLYGLVTEAFVLPNEMEDIFVNCQVD